MTDSHATLIDLILCDFDGVMTDNRVLVLENGTEAVRCNRADGLGCDLLRAANIPLEIVSTETNRVVAERAKKLQVKVAHGVTDKADLVTNLIKEYALTADRVMFIGNDINDLSAMEIVGWPVAPADGHPDIRAIARYVTVARGGEGVVREIADFILKGQ
ncbi:MAG: HAD hydrolase family protein [Alphaproteobacteria bacterium]|nr:HAD hydrolase family protein [Alphaproteobacteria bacterium]